MTEGAVIFLFILTVIGFILMFFVGFTVGRRLGAKEGIDYCFEQKYKKELHDTVWHDSSLKEHLMNVKLNANICV